MNAIMLGGPVPPAADAVSSRADRCAWSEDEIDDLRVAVLLDSIRMLFDHRVSGDRQQSEIAWIMSDTLEPFSFPACAIAADADPAELRALILEQHRRHRADGVRPV